MVGDVYVRIYNEQSSFLLESFEQFAIALLGYMRRTGEILYKNMTPEVTADDLRVREMTGKLTARLPNSTRCLVADLYRRRRPSSRGRSCWSAPSSRSRHCTT